MRITPFMIGMLRTGVILVSLLFAGVAHADTSSSFTLTTGLPEPAVVSTAESDSFTMQESQNGWYESPLASTHFQIVPPSGTTSSSAHSVSSSVQVSQGAGSSAGGRGTHGQSRRPRVDIPPASSVPSSDISSSRSTQHPAAPDEKSTDSIGDHSSSIATSELGIVDGIPLPPDTILPFTVHFFDAIDDVCTEMNVAPSIISFISVMFVVALLAGAFCIFVCSFVRKKKKGQTLTYRWYHTLLIVVVALITLFCAASLAYGATSVPTTHVYNGRLLDNAGAPITTAHSIRFSYWTSADAVSGDITGAGAINTGSATYAGWQEVHTVTPNASGYFSVKIGSITALPSFSDLPLATLISLYLQVEVKASANADTAYEILDPDSTDTAIDRSGVLSVPFAENANMIDQREIGTGSGSIPLLGSGGTIAVDAIPGGTNSGTFVIDADNSESGEISLSFGSSLGKKLTYDIVNNLFKFNASLQVQGNLTVTGLINGVDISSLAGLSDALKASSGGGLNLNVFAGSYRLNGVITNFAGSMTVLSANTTHYVFFGSGGLTKNTTGFPTDEGYIPVADVTTSTGAITSIIDRRITASDDREKSVVQTFSPNYEKASYQGDGANNVGQLSISHDNISLKNFYLWTTTKTTLQDYDLLLRVPVSRDFVRWTANGTTNPLRLNYRTTSASSADNALDLQVYDTNGVPVTLSGSTTSLAGTSWSTANVEFTGTPTWTAGEDMLIRIKFSAKDEYQAQLGELKLEHTDLARP